MRTANFYLVACCSALVLYTGRVESACAKKILSMPERKKQKKDTRDCCSHLCCTGAATDNINVLKKVTGVRERKEQKAYTHRQSGCALLRVLKSQATH